MKKITTEIWFLIAITIMMITIITFGYFLVKRDNEAANRLFIINKTCIDWCGSQKVILCSFPDNKSDLNPKGVWCQEDNNTAKFYIKSR